MTVKNYQRGKDFLRPDTAGLRHFQREGNSAKFNVRTGVLTFTGGAVTVATAQRLLQNVQYASTAASPAKRLVVAVKDGAVTPTVFSFAEGV